MPKPPSDPRRDADSFFAPENEVLDVYTGDTLEEAMAGAVAALGPDLEVRRARKVRSGVRGLMGRPVYEVLAVAGRSSGGGGDPLRSAVDRLLERADAQEARGVPGDVPAAPSRATPPRQAAPPREAAPPRGEAPPRGASRPREAQAREAGVQEAGAPEAGQPRAARPHPGGPPRSAVPAPPVAADGPPAEARSGRPRRLPAAGGSAADRVDPVERTQPPRRTDLDDRPELEAPRPEPRPARRPAADGPRTPGWSRAGLARIGVPAAVLNALPRDAPSDDLGWLVSVTAAIAACVGPPAGTGPDHPVVVNGFGLSGVLGILEAGCRGATPGRISFAGRTTDATALELALVLHASLTGR